MPAAKDEPIGPEAMNGILQDMRLFRSASRDISELFSEEMPEWLRLKRKEAEQEGH